MLQWPITKATSTKKSGLASLNLHFSVITFYIITTGYLSNGKLAASIQHQLNINQNQPNLSYPTSTQHVLPALHFCATCLVKARTWNWRSKNSTTSCQRLWKWLDPWVFCHYCWIVMWFCSYLNFRYKAPFWLSILSTRLLSWCASPSYLRICRQGICDGMKDSSDGRSSQSTRSTA